MSDRTIQVGLAGFGMSGQIFHAPFIFADPRFTLKKVYERTTDKAKQAYPGVETVRTFEELLTEDIDLIVVSTPNQYHVPMAAQAIRAGKNVIVEKPAAASSREAGSAYWIWMNPAELSPGSGRKPRRMAAGSMAALW